MGVSEPDQRYNILLVSPQSRSCDVVMTTTDVLSRFEAFDEPWKKIFNTQDEKWETEWGLMDPGRKVKEGLKIPDCGGRTVDKPY